MEKKTLRAGIVGSGFAASFHVEALRKVYGVEVEIAGVYSRNARNREKFAQQREIPVFESLEELIDASDVLHACVPPSAHETVALKVLELGKSVVIEKPYTGYFGDGSREFSGDTFSREKGQAEALASVRRMREAEESSAGTILYAENWVYAPAIQKEREIIEKSGAQVIWLHGEESHSGSHSQYYGIWSYSGGGSMIGKGVHPLTAALYLKKVEGQRRSGEPIRPRTVSARTHAVTRSPHFQHSKHLKTGYTDIEDFAALHVVFDDDTVADIFASELVLGGVHNWIEIAADNHRGRININPNDSFLTYTPRDRKSVV